MTLAAIDLSARYQREIAVESSTGLTEIIYDVVINDEEQYSIWRVGRPVPDGWYSAGFRGPKADCLAHVEKVWTDMRPKSLRERMERTGNP